MKRWKWNKAEYEKGLREILATSVDWKYVNKKYQENYVRKMVANRLKDHRRVQRILRKFQADVKAAAKKT